MRHRPGWDAAALVYFVCCGVSRLARYNVTAETLAGDESGKVKYFEGTPIPTSILIVGLLAAAFWTGRIDDQFWLGAVRVGPATLHPFTLIYFLSGSAMISATPRFPRFARRQANSLCYSRKYQSKNRSVRRIQSISVS